MKKGRTIHTPVQRALLRLYRKTGTSARHRSWSRVADQLGVNKGLVYSVAQGRKPAPPAMLDRLHDLGFKLHHPRSAWPARCWCGRTHMEKRQPRKPPIHRLNMTDLMHHFEIDIVARRKKVDVTVYRLITTSSMDRPAHGPISYPTFELAISDLLKTLPKLLTKFEVYNGG